MTTKHFLIVSVDYDGRNHFTCGFWEDQYQARDAVDAAYPDHIVTGVTESHECPS